MISRVVLICLAVFLILHLAFYAVSVAYLMQLLRDNLEAQRALVSEFWYRVYIEKHFREQEAEMILMQIVYLRRQCKMILEALKPLLGEDWLQSGGYLAP